MTTIEYLESLKVGLNRTLHKRLDEINSYPFDSEHNWRLSEIQTISEDIQHYTNAIFALKNFSDES